MPRKTSTTTTHNAAKAVIGVRKSGKSDEWAGFVQCEVSELQREMFDEWRSEPANALDALLVDALASGLKLSLVWDGSNECFIATFSGRPDSKGELAWLASLSARAGDFPTALHLLCYKHFDLTGGEWEDWLVNGVKAKRNFG